jgi:hypothetical protein
MGGAGGRILKIGSRNRAKIADSLGIWAETMLLYPL